MNGSQKGKVVIMRNINTLAGLIKSLQATVQRHELTTVVISNASEKLASIGYKEYDIKKFPKLRNTSSFVGSIGSSPSNLSEALLWKLGRWSAYESFVKNFNTAALKVSSSGGVVFSAFAKHLQDNSNPIYDQHAIRALWAICEFNEDHKMKCEALLFNSLHMWKDAGSGDDGSCYEIFVSHVNAICNDCGVSNEELDRLLMPLGQAIKKVTRVKGDNKSAETDLDRFRALCWPRDTHH